MAFKVKTRIVAFGNEEFRFGVDIKTTHQGRRFRTETSTPLTHAHILDDREGSVEVEIERRGKRIYIGFLPKSIIRIDEETLSTLGAKRLVIWMPLWLWSRMNLDKRLAKLSGKVRL